MQIDGFDGRANGFLFFFQESESLPMHYDLSLFVICVECCRRVQISWNYFAARIKAEYYLFALKGVSWQSSEDFSVFGCYWSTHVQGPPKPAPVAESAPAAAPGRRFLQSETNKMLSSIYWIIFVSYLVQSGWFALHWQRLRNIRKD